MTFDNSKTIIGVRIKLFVATVLFLVYLVMAYIAKWIPFPLLGMDDTAWTVIITVIYIVFLFYPMYLNYQYIYFSDDGYDIIFRYFNAGIAGGRKNSVEINKTAFAGYKLEKKAFGLKQNLILFQKMHDGIAKYPPIYISSLTDEERKKVFGALKRYAPEK